MELLAYDQYVHTVTSAYRLYGQSSETIRRSIEPYSKLRELGPNALVDRIAPAIRSRLSSISLALSEQVISSPFVRFLNCDRLSIAIPIINQQGVEWYSESPLGNFVFVVEKQLGLIDGAHVIYDLGGHHGVWAAFYAKSMLPGGAVYSFEPSILNIEVSSLLFMINDIYNVVSCATAVGLTTDMDGGEAANSEMLVDFVDKNIRIVDFRTVSWQKGDFLKMDIEGFEYDLLLAFPWIFDLATNLHIELHIPHLERRGLDYKRVMNIIPFEKFEVLNSVGGQLEIVESGQDLSGYCSLMMKRRVIAEFDL